MAKFREYAVASVALCAMMAVLLIMQGCQKAVSVSPKTDSGRQTASVDKTETAKPKSASTGTADLVKPKKSSTGEVSSSAPVQEAAAEPKPAVLPKADIDTHDAKYLDGKSPSLEANGKPVTVLYLTPNMFGITLTRGGQEKARLTLGTVTVSGDKGNKIEVHITAMPTKPTAGKMEEIALIYSDKTKKGQSWSTSAAGMNFKVEALDYGEWNDSPFPGTGMGWLKLRITAKGQ